MADRRARTRTVFQRRCGALALTALLTLFIAGPIGGIVASPVVGRALAMPAATQVSITSFSFQPSSVSANSQTSGSVALSGGMAPYFLWFNNTPSNCAPTSNPVMISSQQYPFNCQPSSTGSFNIHLDVADSSSPAGHTSASTTLTVTSNSGNGNGNGNNGGSGNGSSGFSFPSGLFQVALLLSIAFIGSMVALAAGMIATAVILSRRLRQLKEALERTGQLPSTPPK
ncbi:MAG: hypothetical protein L3K23_01455 [Thermoplasmata archaeon]|nr:hypothetical protein [Thermoplasmata archaeon]